MERVKIQRLELEQILLSIILNVANDEDIKAFNDIYKAYKMKRAQFGLHNTQIYFEQFLLPIVIKKSDVLIKQIKDNSIKQTFINSIKREEQEKLNTNNNIDSIITTKAYSTSYLSKGNQEINTVPDENNRSDTLLIPKRNIHNKTKKQGKCISKNICLIIICLFVIGFLIYIFSGNI